MRKEIEQYYLNDTNSSLCSGMKECINIKDKDGLKISVQKRMLLYNLKDLYINWINSTSHEIVPCLVFFCQLKPKQCVFPGDPGTHSICVCSIHQNLKLKLSAINPNVYYRDAISVSVCSIENKECMLHICEQCPTHNNNVDPIIEFVSNGIDVDEMGDVKYSIWTTLSASNNKSDTSTISRISLVEFEEPFKQVLRSTAKDIYDMTSHHFISQKQKEYYCFSRDNVDDDTGVLCMDFAENYAPIAQESVQAFYFNNQTVTLFTAVLYYKSRITNEVECQSYCVISDTSIHQAYSVHIFLEAIINHIKSAYSTIKRLLEWSDGAPTQFKYK